MIEEVCVLSSSPTLCVELGAAFADDHKICLEPTVSAETAVKRAVCGCSSAILIDDDPSDMTTAELLRHVRGTDRGRDALVVLMSSKASEIDRVIAFELGADDFIAKPIGTRELSLRLSAVLRRHRDRRIQARKLCVGPFVLDTKREEVTCRGEKLSLTSVEFRLLEHLARHEGQVQDRRMLLARVWRWCDGGEDRGGLSRTVDTHVKRLREKLGPAAEFVETIRGVGYRLRPVS
jgi:two-component system phosphate regulon response regulator PhoB